MKRTKTKILSVFLSFCMIISCMVGMSVTASAEPTETLQTTITATGQEQASYSKANVATVSFSYSAEGSSSYLATWGWWGYGWTATVTPAEGYTITKCVFYDDQNRKATDSEAPFVVETTEEDKTPKVNGNPILEYTSKGIKKIEVYGYVAPAGKTAGSITYTTTEVEKKTDAAQFTNPLTKVGDGEVTYSITGDVATIDATSGQVVLTGKAGTATVTATVADSDDYEYATKTATYELTTKLPELYPSPIFTFSSDDYIYWVAHWVPEQGAFTRSAGDITKIEALIDVRSIDWGVIQLGSAEDTKGDSYSILPSECKAVSYEGTMPEASYAQVVLSGDADLWGVRVTYKDGTVVSDGTWSIPEYTIPTGLEATEGDTLSDVELPTGWSWLNSSESVGTVGDNIFEAEYSETGYFPVAKGLTVTVHSAGPVTPTITTAPTASAITYGQTLADSNLSDGAADVDGTFSWTTDTIAPAVADSNTTEYDVTFTPNDTDNYTTAACKVKLTVNKAEPTADDFIFNAPENLSYDGTDKTAAVVPDPEVTGMGEVTVKYYSDADCTTEVQNTRSAGTYYVVITVTEGDNYSETTSVLHGDDWTFVVTKADPTADDFIFNAPENLSYDGTDKTATVVPDPEVTGMGEVTVKYYSDAECTTEVQNTRSAGTYYVGITVTEGDNYSETTSVLYGDDWQFTIGKADPTVTAPTENELTYNGSAQALVTGGSVTGGELQYSLDGTDYSAAVPTATDAGDYRVYYKVVGDENHSDTKPASITVTIAKAASRVTTAPAAKKLTFNGEKQELVTAGTAEGGTMQYSLNGGTYSADIPTAIAAGTYTVYYKAVGDKNHKDSEERIVIVNIAGPVIPTPYNTFYDPSDTTTTTTTTNTTPDITKYTITVEQDRLHWIRLTWDDIQDEIDYRLYLQSRGQYVFLMDLGNANNANVVRSASGSYYVSTGGDYSIFEYDSKTGQFTQTGTLEASKIDSIKKANNVTEDFMVKYIVDGKESTESNSYKVSVNIYYKPAVQITANKSSIMLKWNKVPGATKYRVYKYVNGSLKHITETTKNAVRITDTKAGKKYSYAVKAYVDGKWTKVYKSDIVSVIAK